MSESRVAVLSVLVEQAEAVEQINAMLHEYAPYIIGRMGLPYREKNISVICVVMDAPQPAISALSGKIGRISGVSTKVAYAKAATDK